MAPQFLATASCLLQCAFSNHWHAAPAAEQKGDAYPPPLSHFLPPPMAGQPTPVSICEDPSVRSTTNVQPTAYVELPPHASFFFHASLFFQSKPVSCACLQAQAAPLIHVRHPPPPPSFLSPMQRPHLHPRAPCLLMPHQARVTFSYNATLLCCPASPNLYDDTLVHLEPRSLMRMILHTTGLHLAIHEQSCSPQV